MKIYQGEELPHPKSMVQVSFCNGTFIIDHFTTDNFAVVS